MEAIGIAFGVDGSSETERSLVLRGDGIAFGVDGSSETAAPWFLRGDGIAFGVGGSSETAAPWFFSLVRPSFPLLSKWFDIAIDIGPL